MAERGLVLLEGDMAMKRFSFFQLFVVVIICAATFFVVFAWINTQTSRLDLLQLQKKGRNVYRSLAILAQDNYVNGENRWRYWPNDIGQNFNNSTEYFSYLMDVKNCGKTDWKPLLCEASLEDVYSGRSSSSPTLCTLWSVAKNVTSNTSDSIPVLISKMLMSKFCLESGHQIRRYTN